MAEAQLVEFIECLTCGRKIEDFTALVFHGRICPAGQILLHNPAQAGPIVYTRMGPDGEGQWREL